MTLLTIDSELCDREGACIDSCPIKNTLVIAGGKTVRVWKKLPACASVAGSACPCAPRAR